MVSPAGDAAGAEKGLLEVMSGVLNYLRNRWSSSTWLGKAHPGPSSPHPQGICPVLQRRRKTAALGVAAL